MCDLKMAAASSSVSDPRNDQSGVNIHFVDEGELPLAHFVEHRVSEEEFYSDESGSSHEECDDLTPHEGTDKEMVAEAKGWSDEINLREDVEFHEEVGINVDSENLRSCLNFFLIFFTAEVWTLLVEQTNLYEEQKKAHQESVWYPVTIDEMKGWVSLYLNMGLVTKPNLASYWSTDPSLSSSFFSSIMPRDRFLQTLRYLHFADNTQAPRARSADFNKLYKIQPFLELIIPRFQQVYKPQRQLAVDETLIKFKGKVHFRQYLPMKPGRFGIKAFTLAESSSGYLLNSKIYTGKEGNVVERDLGKKAVLCVMEPFLDKGYYVFMDNYYTSVALFEELEERKTLACGTVRSNRSGLPKEICGIKEKKVKQLKWGESLYRQKGNVTCVTENQ